MDKNKIKAKIDILKGQPIVAMLTNLCIMMLLYMLCRLFFYVVNHNYYTDMTMSHFVTLCKGGTRFDLTAVLYTNILYIIMMALPLKIRSGKKYQKAAKAVFVIFNSIAIIPNLSDVPFFSFTNRRTTFSIFNEFGNEGNIGSILAKGVVEYWYVTIVAAGIIYGICKLFVKPVRRDATTSNALYYATHTVLFCLTIWLTIAGMRGGFTRVTRPITLSNANQYVNKSSEAAIVLNTPFCIYRTIGKKSFKNPNYYADAEEMEKIYTPVTYPDPQGEFKPMNVVVIILESFGKEYSKFFNPELEEGKYEGFTPFLDSLYKEGLTFKYSYATGRKSIDAMPSVLSSIPMFEEPFILTQYYDNKINSIASCLNEKGYYTAFFHGAPNGSMGFQAYAKAAGFKDYYGETEYGNSDDFDGFWAIWDEEFLQFYADKMSTFSQPFMTSLFTASSHHPFQVPERYVGKFREGTNPLHKCIGYTDNALRLFFEKVSKTEWYKNTLFVITADHTNQITHDEYRTDEKLYSVPILFFHPGSDLKGMKEGLASQADIMPSVLGYLNYDKPYVAFGTDVLSKEDSEKFVVNYNNPLYQMLQGNYMMQFDGERVVALYDVRNDAMLGNNLHGQKNEIEAKMLPMLKAEIQQYMMRMAEDKLTANTISKQEIR